METNVNLTDNVNTLFHGLEEFTQKEGLIGKPVTQGDKTFLPIVSLTLGYGGGSTGSKPSPTSTAASNNSAAAANMTGGAQGLGAKLCTDAVIMIDKGTATVIPLNSGINPSQLVDKIPQIVSGMNQNQNKPQ